MENNQQKRKNSGLIALIAILLIITTVASCSGLYAWAKYISSQGGNATAQVAKWHFNLKTGAYTVGGPQLLSLTRTDGNSHVETGKLAPGTSGVLPIIVETTGTETDLTYDVTITINNCPQNVVFTPQTPDSTTQTVTGSGTDADPRVRTIRIQKYVPHTVTDANRLHDETVTWSWPYETTTGAGVDANDQIDNADSGKEVTVTVTAVGTEVLKDPNVPTVQQVAQSGAINRWDSVNYNPGDLTTASIELPDGTSIEGSKLASITLPSGASLSDTISATEADDWVVLDVNETTGVVRIIPRTYSSTSLTLTGMDGYNNAITALDRVASIYKNEKYATESKSLTIEDVNGVEGYDPTEVASGSASASGTASGNGELTYSWTHRYGMDANLNIVDYGEGNEEERTYVSTPATKYYSYTTDDFNNNGCSSMYCWLASRCVNLNSNNCNFNVRNLNNGNVNNNNLFNVNNNGNTNNNNNSYPVVPVASINWGCVINDCTSENRNKLYPLVMCNNYKIKTDGFAC